VSFSNSKLANIAAAKGPVRLPLCERVSRSVINRLVDGLFGRFGLNLNPTRARYRQRYAICRHDMISDLS